jgi:hypothetical protein
MDNLAPHRRPETVQALQREVQELEQDLQGQVSDITARWDDAVSKFESVPVRPSRSDVRVDMFALAWAPHWQIKYKAKDGSGKHRRGLTSDSPRYRW